MTTVHGPYLPERRPPSEGRTRSTQRRRRRLESCRAVCDKGGAGLCDAVGEGELEVGGHELLDVRAAYFSISTMRRIWCRVSFRSEKRRKATHVDGPEAGTVTSSHVLVHALDSISTQEVAVLLVHVVRARAGVVPEPDAKVLDLERLFLVDLDSLRVSDKPPLKPHNSV